MRDDNRITNQNGGAVCLPTEDKNISQILIKNPALKTINNNPMN